MPETLVPEPAPVVLGSFPLRADGLPDPMNIGRVAIPDDAQERVAFLCEVFDPHRNDDLADIAHRLKITESHFAERIEEARREVGHGVRVGVVARATGQMARAVGIIHTDEDQADLVDDLAISLRERTERLGRPGDTLEGVMETLDGREKATDHLSLPEQNAFDAAFSEHVYAAEDAAAGIKRVRDVELIDST